MNLGLEEVGLDSPEQIHRDMYFQWNGPTQRRVLQLVPYHSISLNPFDFHSMTDIAIEKVDSVSQISLGWCFMQLPTLVLTCCWCPEHRCCHFHMHSME